MADTDDRDARQAVPSAPGSAPDNTAVRVALWRALHVEVDAPPHVLDDRLGLALVAPEGSWRKRPDMHPQRTSRSRASIVARARFVEDLVAERARHGVAQYVLLGAGLDTFAQRNLALASKRALGRASEETTLRVFEVEQPETQAWKRARLSALGHALPASLHLVPVDFEAQESWLPQLVHAGFAPQEPAVFSSLGVIMYLTKEAIVATLRQVAQLAPGTTFVLSFMLPLDLIEKDERASIEGAARGARAAGTPFVSLFAASELAALARDAGFTDVQHISSAELARRYFLGRPDGLRPSSGEEIIVATV